jgi:hypothetical protein
MYYRLFKKGVWFIFWLVAIFLHTLAVILSMVMADEVESVLCVYALLVSRV